MPKKYRYLIRYWKKHKIDLAVLAAAILTALISLFIYIQTGHQLNEKQIKIHQTNSPTKKKETGGKKKTARIFVDLSGAILKPDLYLMKKGDRLNDLLKKGGGLAKNADRNFFARNFNLANRLVNGEKVYIPSYQEIRKGLFQEPERIIDYHNSDSEKTSQADNLLTNSRININRASQPTLETLPGVGATTATKIINSRPYRSVQELLTRKILSQKVFDKIKGKVEN